MCFREVLCQTNDGEVALSCCGNHYKVSFFHLVMVYDKEDFSGLYRSLHQCLREVKHCKNKETKSIIFSTPLNSMRLRFSVSDIEQLHYLIETAYFETKNFAFISRQN